MKLIESTKEWKIWEEKHPDLPGCPGQNFYYVELTLPGCPDAVSGRGLTQTQAMIATIENWRKTMLAMLDVPAVINVPIAYLDGTDSVK